MAFSAQGLRRRGTQAAVGNADGSSGLAQVSDFIYATADAAATVEANGYFNAARGLLTVGSLITAAMGIGSGVVGKSYIVATVPATGNVTIALFAAQSG